MVNIARSGRRLLGIAAVAVLALAGCASAPSDESGTGGSGGAAETVSISVGLTPIANAATVYLALEHGYFEEEGLEVTPTTIQAAAAAIPQLLNDELQFALISPVPTMTAASKGLGVRIVAANDRYGEGDFVDAAALVAADGGVSEIGDLAGKTIAVVGLKSAPELVTRLALENAGVDPTSVEFVEIAYPDMVSALTSARVDAAVVVDPFLSQAKEQGLELLGQPFVDGAPGQVGTTWVTSQSFVDEHPEAAEGFRNAIAKAVDYAKANPDAVREIMGTYTELSDEALANTLLPQFDASIDAADLQFFADAMYEQSFIDTEYDAAELLWKP